MSFVNAGLIVSLVFSASVLAGCSGSGSVAQCRPTTTPNISKDKVHGPTVSLVIRHAGRLGAAGVRSASTSTRRPMYISPSSQSLSVQVGTLPVVYNDLTLANPNCSETTPGYLDCEIPISAPTGTSTFAFNLYDKTQGGGSLLATSTQTVSVSGSAQTIDVAMHAVVQKITLSASAATVPLSRTPFTSGLYTYVKLAVNAQDADGNTVTDDPSAPVTFNAPITVTDRDASGPATGLIAVANGSVPVAGTSPVKTVTVPDPSTDLYAVYYGGFIRAVAFDASSSDVTNPANLFPTGFTTDCQGNFAVAQSLPGTSLMARTSLRAKPNFVALPLAAKAGSLSRQSGVQPKFGGGTTLWYDANYLGGCKYQGAAWSCGLLDTLAAGQCVSMGVGFDDGSGGAPNGDNLHWDANGGSNLVLTILPANTYNTIPTCYEMYVPPANSNTGDILQPNAGTPWFGRYLDNPVVDFGESVAASPMQITPSTYYDDLEDCVATTQFPTV